MVRGERATGGRDPGRAEDECSERGREEKELRRCLHRASPSSFSRCASARVPGDVRHKIDPHREETARGKYMWTGGGQKADRSGYNFVQSRGKIKFMEE